MDAAPIALALHALDQAEGREAVGHTGYAVRFEQHGSGELSDGQAAAVGRAQREKDLVLLRSKAGTAGDLFSEMREGPQLGPDQSQGAIVPVADQRTWPLCHARRWRSAAANMKPKRISRTPPPKR